MLCSQTFGAVLGNVVCVRYRWWLWRLVFASVELMVVGGLMVGGCLPIIVQVPKRRCPHVMGRRRRRRRHDVVLFVDGDARLLFHHIARKRTTTSEITKSTKNAIVDVAVNVLDYRYLVDLKGKNIINNLIKLLNIIK